MRIVVIIQARLGSTRLPEKVLLDLKGKPVIQRVYERACKIKKADEIIIATTLAKTDDRLVEFCKNNGMTVCRGSENDVLDRYYRAAKHFQADAVIRITGDCPLLDPCEVDKVVEMFLSNNFDYVSNTQPPMLPDGLDASIGSFQAYEKSWKEASLRSEREHVTQYMRNHPELFKTGSVGYNEDHNGKRWTIDEPNDYTFISEIYSRLKGKKVFGNFTEVLSILDENPELSAINASFERDEGLKKSLIEESAICINTNFRGSGKLLEKTKLLMPAAASTYSKSYRYFCEGAAPAFLDRGKGSHVWDIDGNEYIDYVLALGPVIVGYGDDRINQAIADQMQKGISFSLTTVLETALAQKLVDIIPCAQMVKFVKNGSDATTAAIRLARAFTRREKILCCGYHGWQDWYVGTTQNDLGVPQSVKELSFSFPYNDLDVFETLLKKNHGEVAAVIMEPLSLELPNAGYLAAVKDITNRHGALLIFDEVVTGFRLGLGGAQKYFGISPDLAAFGKAMGNGMPISALVGRRDVLELIEQGAFVSTTFGGETLSIAAALKTIEILENENPFEVFTARGECLMNGMKTIVKALEMNDRIEFVGMPYHFALKFKGSDKLSHFDLLSVFQQEAIHWGVLMLGVHNFCLAHTSQDITDTLEAYEKAFLSVKEAIDNDSLEHVLKGGRFSPIFKRDRSR